MPREIRRVVRRSLMQEQGFICCYCESRISMDDCHVEHFRPREGNSGRYSDQQLLYQNMHCSCQGESDRGEPRHCRHKKGCWYDVNLLISPLDEDCEYRFRFSADGGISPRLEDDSGAEITIRKLGLDLPKLRALRAAALDVLYEVSQEEVRRLLARRPGGEFLPFYTIIEQVLAR